MTTKKPPIAAIVLAAGQGTRMKSSVPKVLHPLLGRPMLTYPVEAALQGGADRVVAVIGHSATQVREMLVKRFGGQVVTALQPQQLGTADAARCGAEALPDFRGYFVILYGDAPLVRGEVLRALIDHTQAQNALLGILVSELSDASGYGRILRDAQGRVVGIREEKDCDAEERRITEWNPGIYAIHASFFREHIGRLGQNNAASELYLTDLVGAAAPLGSVVDVPWPAEELLGVNDRLELILREKVLRRRILERHARNGVTIRDPDSTWIDADVEIGADVTLEGHVHLRRRCRIGAGTQVEVGCVLDNVTTGQKTTLLPYTVATDSQLGDCARVGPFSHLRPGSVVGDAAHVGNFVEMKNTTLGPRSKANHLAYLGDGAIGRQVNIGAGVIFCNYDGFNKHQTVVQDDAFIGSDAQLIAPITVGQGAYVGTGTTVTQDVPSQALAIGRARQVNKPGLATRLMAKLKAKKAASQS